MTEQLYKIKPLEWDDITSKNPDFSMHKVYRALFYKIHLSEKDTWNLFDCFSFVEKFFNLEEAKAAAEAHYIKRMEERLIKC